MQKSTASSLRLVAILLFSYVALSARAASYTNNSVSPWTNSSAWTSGSFSTNDPDGIIVLSTPTTTTRTNDYSIVVLNKLFLTQNTVTLQGGGLLRFTNSGALVQMSASGGNNINEAIEVTGPTIFRITGSSPITVNSNISGAGSLIVSNSGSGQLILNGGNTFAGGVILSNGSLRLGSATALSTGNFTIATSGAILDAPSAGITLTTTNNQAWNSDFTFTGTGNLTMGPGTVTLGTNVTVTTSAKTLTVPGAITGAYALVKSGAGTLVLTNGGNDFSSLTVNGGTNQLGSGGAGVNVLGSATVTNNGVLTFNFGSTGSALYSNQIAGTGSLNLLGTSVIYLSGSNSFSGGTYLSSGNARLAAGNDNVLGNSALYFINSGSGLSATGTAARTLANSLVFSNNATLGNGTDSGLLNLTGSANLAGAWRQLTISSEVNMSGVVSNGGFTKLGNFALTLSGANVFGNGLSNAAGTLVIGNDNALGTGLLTFSGGSLSNTGNHIVANTVNLGSSARISVASGESLTLGGAITNAGGLVKVAGGTLSLNGNNSYAGATLVSNGTLRVNGVSSGTGGLTVYSNATLGGTGSLRGVTIADGGWLAPGNSIGTLTVSNLTLSSGSLLSFELAATNASDQVVDLGTLTLAQMSFSNFAFSTNDGFGMGTYTLINAALHNGIFNPVTNESFYGFIGTVYLGGADGNDLILGVASAIPEPSVFALLGLGVFLALRRRTNA